MSSPDSGGPAGSATVSFAAVGAAEKDFWGALRHIGDAGARRICDVGGGARPVLALERVQQLALDYLVIDESPGELERAPEGYARAAASILDAPAIGAISREHGAFDVVISRWTAEHVKDGRRFHENVRELLRPGGSAIHLFPTLYAPPFLLNRLLPGSLASGLLFQACPNRSHKFKPYYSWCRGPSPRQLARLRSVGFEVERYTGYYGHGFYRRLPPLAAAQRAFNRLLIAHPVPALTAFALVVLRRTA